MTGNNSVATIDNICQRQRPLGNGELRVSASDLLFSSINFEYVWNCCCIFILSVKPLHKY